MLLATLQKRMFFQLFSDKVFDFLALKLCHDMQDSGMKTLIALDDQEELIDKFEEAANGINNDMALAEKALKVNDCDDEASSKANSVRPFVCMSICPI